jgi:hypothetical protein
MGPSQILDQRGPGVPVKDLAFFQKTTSEALPATTQSPSAEIATENQVPGTEYVHRGVPLFLL